MQEKSIKKWKSQRTEPKEHWISEYFKKNPLRCITAGLTTIGLLVMLTYQFQIECAAQYDIKSLASTIFLAAFVGVSLCAGCGFVIFVPTYFVRAYAFQGAYQDAGGNESIAEGFFFSGIAFLGFFGFLFVVTAFDLTPATTLLAPVELALLYLLVKSLFHKNRSTYVGPYGHHTDLAWWKWASLKTAVISRVSPWYKAHAKTLKLLAFMAFIYYLQVLPIQIYFLLMRDAPILSESKTDWLTLSYQLLMICGTLQATGFYLVKAWQRHGLHRIHRFYSLIVVLMAPFLVTLWGGNQSFFPFSVAYLLKTGNFATTEMTLTTTGCDIVAGKGGTACSAKPEVENKIYGAYVVSRIGTEVFLKMRSAKSKSLVCVYLPAKEVLGMKIDETKRFYNARSIAAFLLDDASIKTGPATDKARPERCDG